MGFYVNPRDMSKEEWLEIHGLMIHQHEAHVIFNEGQYLPVCLIDNGPFFAAGIGFSPEVIDAMSRPGDIRPKKWFAVDKTILIRQGFITAQVVNQQGYSRNEY